jgi:hypothetical protein
MYCDLKPFENNQKARRFLKHLMAEKKNLLWQKQPKFFYKCQATPFHFKVSR